MKQKYETFNKFMDLHDKNFEQIVKEMKEIMLNENFEEEYKMAIKLRK